jgi:hypothetical protein
MSFEKGSSVFSEGAASVATVVEKSVPLVIREMVAKGKLYLQHARQLRQQYDALSSQRESDHQKLVSSGVGPVDSKEVLKLQQSRWQILADNEAGLRELIGELQSIVDDRQEQHAESQRLIQQYHDDGVSRLINDFGASPSIANSRMGADKDLQALKQQADDVRQQGNAVRQMILSAEGDIQAIADARTKLSKQWRTF